MKHIKLNIKWLTVIAVMFALFISACEKEADLGSPDRLFRPVVSELEYSGNWIKVECDKYKGVDSFLLQLSADSFQTYIYDVTTDTTFYIFEDLEYDTDYFFRVKSFGNGLVSEFNELEMIRTSDYPTKLNSITADDIIDSQVKVTWNGVNYDSLCIYRGDTMIQKVIVNDEDNVSKEKYIKALSPEKSYYVKAYTNGLYQGKKGFTTIAPQILGGNVIDLRDYSDEESYGMINQAFFDSLAIVYPEGITVVLSGGTRYELDGPKLTSSLTMLTGYSLNGKAIVEVKGNFDTEADAQIGKIHFEKISFTDHIDHPKTDGNYGSTYLMNISGALSSIDTLSIENCDIRYKRGVVRIKTAATVKEISINNCFIDSIAGYGVVNLDNGDIITNSISVTNSTIAHTEMILRNTKPAQALETMLFSNVTTYYTPKSIIFRMGAIKNATISDCLLGSIWSPESGVEALSGTIETRNISNNFRTSDCNWMQILDDAGIPTGEKNPIEATQLSESSAETFADPDHGDYTVSDSRLQNKVGDPRWW